MAYLFALAQYQRPTRRQEAEIERRLAAIDSDLRLVAHTDPGVRRSSCWIEAPDGWANAAYRPKVEAASAALYDVMAS